MWPSVGQAVLRGVLRCPQQKIAYVALGEKVKEAFFTGRGVVFCSPRAERIMCLEFENNRGAITLAANPLSFARRKHIDVHFHFVGELLCTKKTGIQFVASEEQHADILTKSLAATPFKYHRRLLINLPLEGG